MSHGTELPKDNSQVVALHELSDISDGMSYEFKAVFSNKEIDDFARLTGDISPLHMDEYFARQRGFTGRVVHGVLLGGLVSRLVGVHLPGANALLQTVNLRFHAPVYAMQQIKVCGIVDQFSAATRTLVLKVTISDDSTGEVRAQGKVQVGFTAANKE